jgi:hypothetical protein
MLRKEDKMKRSLTPKGVSTRNRVLALLVLLAVITTGGFSATSAAGALLDDQDPAPRIAIVATDQNDYEPGTTVTITGSGWDALESVALSLKQTRDGEPVAEYSYSATADAEGNIVNTDYTPGEGDRGTDYVLTATGSNSGLVSQTSFSDAFTNNSQVQVSASYGANTPPVCPGTSITIVGTVSKLSAGNYTYQWLRGTAQANATASNFTTVGNPGTATVSGNGNNLSFTANLPVSAASGAYYVLRVNDGANNLYSQTGSSTFQPSVKAPVQLGSLSASGPLTSCDGSTITFTANPTGTGPFTYKWEVSPNVQFNSSNTDLLQQGSSNTLNFPVANGPDKYIRVTVTDSCGNTATQYTGPIKAVQPISITGQPQSTSTKVGVQATFSAQSSDASSGVQWQKFVSGSWQNISGANSLSLNVTPQHVSESGTQYRAVFTSNNICGPQATNPATLTVTKGDATVTITNLSHTYNGTAKSASVSTSPAGLSVDVTYDGSATAPTNAGSYAVSAVVNDADYAGSSSDTLVINKAAVTATAGSGHVTYDGSAQSPSDCAVTGAYTGDLSCSNNPASKTNAGTYTVNPVVSGTGLSNFNVTSVAGTLTIDKANADCSSIAGYSVTYNGAAHTATGACKGVDGAALSGLDLSQTTHTDAGDYNGDAWTFTDSTGNYNDDDGTVDSSIAKAPVTATAGSGSSVYDGSAKSPSACAVSGTYTGDLGCSNDQTSVGPNAGTTTIKPVVSGTGLSNFDITKVDGSYTIAKANADCSSIAGYTGTYNGAAHGASGVCTGVDAGGSAAGSSLSLGASFTNVPGGVANWSFTGGNNYNDQSGSVNIVINKANATITVNGYEGFYDSAAHGATGSATGVNGEDLSSLLNLGASFTNVPGGTANWTFNSTNSNGNYNSASGSVLIKIKAWTLTGFYQPVDMTPAGAPALVLNSIKGGSTVPLKFEVFAGNAEKSSVADIKSFVSQEFNCSAALSTLADVEITTTGGTSLRYDLTGGQFIQNWQTPKTVGKCYQVRMTTQDGSKLDAFFKTK